jgi:vesicle coat complex subunit
VIEKQGLSDMSAVERMIAFHLARLQDKNPEVRIRAIKELALLDATETYDTMEQLFRTDPDPEVRRAAQEAGRALFKALHRHDDDT